MQLWLKLFQEQCKFLGCKVFFISKTLQHLSIFSPQNKVFVYRGKEYEKIGEFVVRLQSQYPSAQVWRQTSYSFLQDIVSTFNTAVVKIIGVT